MDLNQLAGFNFFPNNNYQPSTVCNNTSGQEPSDNNGGGYTSTQPTWIIDPWSAGWGYMRQNWDKDFGEDNTAEGQIILTDINDSKNNITLGFGLSNPTSDNKICGTDITYSCVSQFWWKLDITMGLRHV